MPWPLPFSLSPPSEQQVTAANKHPPERRHYSDHPTQEPLRRRLTGLERMFSFLRTSRSLWKSRLASNPNLGLYRVKFLPPQLSRRWGLPVAAVGLTCAMIYYNSDLVDRIVTKEPWYLPIWFMHPTDKTPYENNGPEFQEFTRLMRDGQRRVNAEGAVLHAIKQRILNSKLDIGHWEGFASPFWMVFSLADPPQGWARKYLAISLNKMEIVTRPIPPRSVMRLSVVMYPRATAAGLQAFSSSIFQSAYSAFKSDTPIGTYKPPVMERNPWTKPSPESEKSDKPPPSVPLLPSSIVMALHEAASNAQETLTKELARDYLKNLPPPPRGWVIADGTVRLVGTEAALIFDFRVAFNPKNYEQCIVYGLNPRHSIRRRGMRIQTFEKPSLPPPPPQPKKQEEQKAISQRKHDQQRQPQEPQQISRKLDSDQQQTLQKPTLPVPPSVVPEHREPAPPPPAEAAASSPPQQQEVPRPQEAPRKR
ncbi:hypothetical protein AA313_de0202215 [Arthrobotrys entomopaga]|nr:hypothetical protein AA313_de0202215 [Arthrobotrys entomopaga]